VHYTSNSKRTSSLEMKVIENLLCCFYSFPSFHVHINYLLIFISISAQKNPIRKRLFGHLFLEDKIRHDLFLPQSQLHHPQLPPALAQLSNAKMKASSLTQQIVKSTTGASTLLARVWSPIPSHAHRVFTSMRSQMDVIS